MKTIARRTDKVLLSNLGGGCDIVAAEEDPVFGPLEADPFTAYARVRFAKTLPMVVGPESISGKVFGMHPAVVARSFGTMRHKQMNLGHQLKILGSTRDRIVGCVLQVAFPDEPEGGWVIPETVEEAPSILALGALFKQAEGVPNLLGSHLGGRVNMSISMEFTYYHHEVGIYDPSDGMCYDRGDIPAKYSGMLFEDDEGVLHVRRTSRDPSLVLALGGVSGRIWFSGIGYTDRPAESSAGIENIAAERRAGQMVCRVAERPRIAPGMKVRWDGGRFGRGVVRDVFFDGGRSLHGITLNATPGDPVVSVMLPDGGTILRRSSGLTARM